MVAAKQNQRVIKNHSVNSNKYLLIPGPRGSEIRLQQAAGLLHLSSHAAVRCPINTFRHLKYSALSKFLPLVGTYMNITPWNSPQKPSFSKPKGSPMETSRGTPKGLQGEGFKGGLQSGLQGGLQERLHSGGTEYFIGRFKTWLC